MLRGDLQRDGAVGVSFLHIGPCQLLRVVAPVAVGQIIVVCHDFLPLCLLQERILDPLRRADRAIFILEQAHHLRLAHVGKDSFEQSVLQPFDRLVRMILLLAVCARIALIFPGVQHMLDGQNTRDLIRELCFALSAVRCFDQLRRLLSGVFLFFL